MARSKIQSLQQHNARSSDEASGDIAKKQRRIAELEALLTRKHPADEQKERQISQWLQGFSPQDRAALEWLLHNGEISTPGFPIQEFPNFYEVIRLAGNTSPKLLVGRTERTPWGDVQHVQINPNYKNALRDVLFPPPRPVVPPSA